MKRTERIEMYAGFTSLVFEKLIRLVTIAEEIGNAPYYTDDMQSRLHNAMYDLVEMGYENNKFTELHNIFKYISNEKLDLGKVNWED